MRRVLVVCPRFAPVNAPDMHRVRQSLPHFESFGWEPTVLAVDPARCGMPLDGTLEHSYPAHIRILRSGAFRQRSYGIGNLDLRALPFLWRMGSRLLDRERFDLVFFSTTAMSVTAAGPHWRRRFGVPYVLDLQDPWVTDYYHRPGAPPPPGGAFKYGMSRSLARLLEPRVIASASHVITVSDAYPVELMQRYPRLDRDRFSVLPFGVSPEDFEHARGDGVRQAVFDPHDGFEHWVYVGAAGEIMQRALRSIFLGLARLRADQPARVAKMRFHFIGTSYAPAGSGRPSVAQVAVECGVGDIVDEQVERLPYFEALRCLIDAHGLLMPGSDDPGYTASKLYPYLLAGRPLLAVVRKGGSLAGALASADAGVVVHMAPEGDPAGLANEVAAGFAAAIARPPAPNGRVLEQHGARAMTRRQCEIFDRVAAERPGISR